MAWEFSGDVFLPADREVVWRMINDPEVLKACIPGIETLRWTGETTLDAFARVRVGPLSAGLKARIALTGIDPPNGYRINAEGDGGFAGAVGGLADVKLAEVAGGTNLSYVLEADVGGRLARLGSHLVGGVARRIADRFFSRFAAQVSRRA